MSREDYGEGSIFQRSDGKWCCSIQAGFSSDGKPVKIRKYAKTEVEVKRKLKEIKKTLYNQSFEGLKKQTIEKYILDWFARYKQGLKPASHDRQENTIKYQIIPFLGQCQIHLVSSSDIKDLMNDLQYKKNYEYSTVKKAYDAINECLRQAVFDRLITQNPCNKHNKPKMSDFSSLENSKKVRFFTDVEVAQFCKEALRYYKTGQPVYRLGWAFILILNTGIRIGEALALRTKNDFDLNKRLMTIDSNMSYVKTRNEDGKQYEFKEVSTKTKNGRRIIPLNDAAYEAVLHLMELNGDKEFLLSTSQGKLILPYCLERSFKCCVKAAGIAACGIHTLRHTYASMLFKEKVDVKIISSLLGHSGIRVTYDTYVHLLDNHATNIARAVNFITLPQEALTNSTL